jgi:PhnB protein
MVERPGRYRNGIVPHIYVDGASNGIDFYKRAFGARGTVPDRSSRRQDPTCRDFDLWLRDHDWDPDNNLYGEPNTLGRCTAGLHIFTDNNEALLGRAVEAGAERIQAPTDMFYGASSASARDPFGHVWVLLTWKEDLTPAEMERLGKKALSVR